MRDIAIAGVVGILIVGAWYCLLLVIESVPLFGGLTSLLIPWDLLLALFLVCGAVPVFLLTRTPWGALLLLVAGCVVMSGVIPLGTCLASTITGG